MTTKTIDIAEIIDGQRWRGFLAGFVVLICAMAIFDGYDYSVMAFAAPSLIREWHVDKSLFGPVFAAATFGGIVGGFLFGYVSDYWGRRYSAIIALFLFGALSLLTTLAANLEQLLVLRFLTGIGIGALMPIIFTIAVEFAPARLRATLAMAAVVSIGLGIMMAGVVGASLVPALGWQVVFWIGGLGPLALGVAAFFALPESPRFLVSRKRPGDQVAAVMRRLDPRFAVPADAAFTDRNKIVKADAGPGKSPVSMLFRGRLAIVTPLLWVTYFVCTISPAILITWLPVLGEGLGIEPRFAALSVSIGGLGLIAASLLLAPLLERFGFIVVWPWPLIALPGLAVLGFAAVGNVEFVALMVLLGFAGGGAQSAMLATVGQFYPDECRGTGVSWAVIMSRFGAVAGPLFVGAALSRGFSAPSVFLLMVAPILLFSVSAFVLGLFHRRLRRDLGARETQTMTEGLSGAAEI